MKFVSHLESMLGEPLESKDKKKDASGKDKDPHIVYGGVSPPQQLPMLTCLLQAGVQKGVDDDDDKGELKSSQ